MATDWSTSDIDVEGLSDADIVQVDSLLEQVAVPHDGMSLEMLDGFLSALVVGPELVKPSEYWREIWNHDPEWPDRATGAEAHRLVLSLWNDIVDRLQVDLPDEEVDEDDDELVDQIEAAMPLLALPEVADDETTEGFGGLPDDFPLAAAWGVGFMRGVGLRAEAWEAWEREDEDLAEALTSIARLTVLDAEQAEQLGLPADDLPDLAERMQITGSIPSMLQAFNQQRLASYGDTHVDIDLCPCGSGKPFQQCCGDKSRLN